MGEKVLILLLLLLGLATELITGTMGAADNLMPKASILKGLEVSSHASSSSPPLPPSAVESASLVSSSASSSSSLSRSDPLVCWSCSSSSHGNPCYNIDPDNATSIASVDSKNCTPQETFCSVAHIWYVVETAGENENVNFSVNRTCTDECNPSCIVIGDRTKIHSCTSCCTESYCNTESSSSSKQTCSISLLVSAFIVALAPMLTISVVPTVTNTRSSSKVTLDCTTASKVFLSSPWRRIDGWCQNSKVVDQCTSKTNGTFPLLLLFSWLLLSACVSSKSFDNF